MPRVVLQRGWRLILDAEDGHDKLSGVKVHLKGVVDRTVGRLGRYESLELRGQVIANRLS